MPRKKKTKIGRPVEVTKAKDLTIRIAGSDYTAIAKQARKHDVSKGTVVRYLVSYALAKGAAYKPEA